MTSIITTALYNKDLTQRDGSKNTARGGRLGGVIRNGVSSELACKLCGANRHGLHLSTSPRPLRPRRVLIKSVTESKTQVKGTVINHVPPGPQGPQACCSDSDHPRKALYSHVAQRRAVSTRQELAPRAPAPQKGRCVRDNNPGTRRFCAEQPQGNLWLHSCSHLCAAWM